MKSLQVEMQNLRKQVNCTVVAPQKLSTKLSQSSLERTKILLKQKATPQSSNSHPVTKLTMKESQSEISETPSIVT